MALYRRGLRLIRAKPDEAKHDFTMYLRHFFRHPRMGGGLSVRDFATIEYMMRRGSKMLEDIYENPSTKRVSLSPSVKREMEELGLAAWRRSSPSS